jgi:8-oxo-dGTP pyrophosphatase MutT (NUDIX family)
VTLLDRIAECNDWDPARFRPFVAAGVPVGFVRDDLAPLLGTLHDALVVSDDVVRLRDHFPDFEARTAAMDGVVAALSEAGRLLPLAQERYPVAPRTGDPPLLSLERAALPAFGIRAHGVHLNGFVRRPNGLHMWIARRARDKPTYPGQLDNMVAGGQPLGLSVRDNLAKECAEEAGIPADLAARAVPTGAVSYQHHHAYGLKRDVLFLFELELPAEFVPVPHDGEVESFELWPVERVLQTAERTQEFKFNCPLAIIDFALRHGLIGPEHPDYVELATGLHR